MSHKFFRRESKAEKSVSNNGGSNNNNNNKKDFSDRKAQLTPLEYRVTQERQTERPFSNKYNRHWEPGSYHCIVCDAELFESDTKFESKSGWPAFSNVVDPKRIKLTADLSHIGANLLLLIAKPDLARTEVSCAKCNAHLGHLFKDGPKPTGLRYCINSSALCFIPISSLSKDHFVSESIESRIEVQKEFPCNPENTCSKYNYSSERDRNDDKLNSVSKKSQTTLPPMASLCLSGQPCQRVITKPVNKTELSQSTEVISSISTPNPHLSTKTISNDLVDLKGTKENFNESNSTANKSEGNSPFHRTNSTKYTSSRGASLTAARISFFQSMATNESNSNASPANDPRAKKWGPTPLGSIRPFTNRFINSISSDSLGLRPTGAADTLKCKDNRINESSTKSIVSRSSATKSNAGLHSQQISSPPVPLKETSL